MSEASDYLLRLSRRVFRAYAGIFSLRAAMVTGSVAEGKSDFHSDIDLIIYYDELPDEDTLAAARHANGSPQRLWVVDDRKDGGLMEAYAVNGVECQVAHTTIQAWEREMSSVLERLDVVSPTQKALSGLLACIPLQGEALIAAWQTRARAYPDALAQAMVERHLQFFPLWGLQGRLATRDATLWTQQSLIEGAQNLLAILAGLNRVYYSTFQFKRMESFVATLAIAPEDCAARLESLCRLPAGAAAEALEALVRETMALVAIHMPSVDTGKVTRRLGWRQSPWQIAPLP